MTHEDNRSLQEQLAERFYNIYGKKTVDLRPWSSIGHDTRAPYLALAAYAISFAQLNVERSVFSATVLPLSLTYDQRTAR
jgi:hypothetical protein